MPTWWTKSWAPREFVALSMPSLESVDLADLDFEKRIVRKQDVRILPWICATYLLSEPSILF